MRAYIEHRIKVAGCPYDDLFSDDSFDVIYRYSGGIPRLINTICDSSLLVAFADEKVRITAAEIEATAEELGWQEHEDTTGTHQTLPHLVPKKPGKSFVTKIEVCSEDETVSEYFFESGRVIVGRSPDSEIYIDSKFISRHHAQFVSDDSGCVLEDLNSTNGVLIDDVSVKKYRLRDGDVVSIGVHKIIYHDLRNTDQGGLDNDNPAVGKA